jgi:hypothetical protein
MLIYFYMDFQKLAGVFRAGYLVFCFVGSFGAYSGGEGLMYIGLGGMVVSAVFADILQTNRI